MSQINTSDQEYRFKEYRGNIQQSRTRYPNTTINPLWNNGSQNRYSYNPTETSTGAPPPPQQQQQAYAQNSFKSYASRNQQASSLNINYNHNHNHNGHYIRHQVVTNGYDNYHNHNHHNHNHNHNHAPISWSNSNGCSGNISNINHAHNYQLGGYRPRHGSSYAASESRHNPLLQYQDVLNGTIDTSTIRIAMFGPVPKGVTLLSSIEAAPIPLGLWESCAGQYKGPHKEETG